LSRRSQGFNGKQFAEVLKESGMLTPPTAGEVIRGGKGGWRQIRVYVSIHGGGKQPARRIIFFTCVVLVLSQLSLLSQFVITLIYKVLFHF
jgi:hypothetical protein